MKVARLRGRGGDEGGVKEHRDVPPTVLHPRPPRQREIEDRVVLEAADGIGDAATMEAMSTAAACQSQLLAHRHMPKTRQKCHAMHAWNVSARRAIKHAFGKVFVGGRCVCMSKGVGGLNAMKEMCGGRHEIK